MPRKYSAIKCSEPDRKIVYSLANSRSAEVRLVERAEMND